MRSRTAEWFECKAKVQKMQEDGTQKPVSEQYVVDALSFTEAEAAITEELSSYYSGFEITDIKKASYHEIYFSERESADRWFKAKLQFIILDEKTEKEKRSNVYYLIHAHTFSEAVENIHTAMGGGMQDYVIASLQETQIMDVYEHNPTAKKPVNDKPEYDQGESSANTQQPAE